MDGATRYNVAFGLVNVVVFGTNGRALPQTRSQEKTRLVVTPVNCIRPWGMGRCVGVWPRRVLSNPHMITSFYSTFYSTTRRWRSNMKSVRLFLPIRLSVLTDAVPKNTF